jgi:hypothetical protein
VVTGIAEHVAPISASTSRGAEGDVISASRVSIPSANADATQARRGAERRRLGHVDPGLGEAEGDTDAVGDAEHPAAAIDHRQGVGRGDDRRVPVEVDVCRVHMGIGGHGRCSQWSRTLVGVGPPGVGDRDLRP